MLRPDPEAPAVAVEGAAASAEECGSLSGATTKKAEAAAAAAAALDCDEDECELSPPAPPPCNEVAGPEPE